MITPSFWKHKRVFLTGHTGFKGAWLSLWLTQMGAKVTGFALEPSTNPSLFELVQLEQLVDSHIGNINDLESLAKVMLNSNPDIVIHMAAQPLVGDSYSDPVGTFHTNVIGTAHVLEAAKQAIQGGCTIRAILNVTTDKCYENKEWHWGYRELDPLGGKDPYSASKACSEIITASYRDSFFPVSKFKEHGVGIATARAGNVIGGGDWSKDRLIPDCINALIENKPIVLRRPQAVRPWQHVLEPLYGYIVLVEHLYEHGEKYSQAWNFGPEYTDCRKVGDVVHRLVKEWKGNMEFVSSSKVTYNEANLLMLDCSKSKALLGWRPVWTLEQALGKIVQWYQAYQNKENMRVVTVRQINQFMRMVQEKAERNG